MTHLILSQLTPTVADIENVQFASTVLLAFFAVLYALAWVFKKALDAIGVK